MKNMCSNRQLVLPSRFVPSSTMESFIRWAGSKRSQLRILERYWCSSQYVRYFEPFAGSASLFFRLEPSQAVLGDLNWELVSALRAVRNDVVRVIEAIRRIRKGRASFYRLRSADPRSLPPAEAAARFLFLNAYCFNGLYRTNKKGQFNVPYAGLRTRLRTSQLASVSALLRHARVLHADFATTVATAGRGDFVYLDPPYALEKRRVFSEYFPESFSTKDLVRLSACLDELNNRGARFVVNYADCSEARRLLARWETRRIWTRRNIAGFSGDRRGSYELLATNAGK